MVSRASMMQVMRLQRCGGAVQARTLTTRSAVLMQESNAGSSSSSTGDNQPRRATTRPPLSGSKPTDFAAALRNAVAGPAGSSLRDPASRRRQDEKMAYGGARQRQGGARTPYNQQQGSGGYRTTNNPNIRNRNNNRQRSNTGGNALASASSSSPSSSGGKRFANRRNTPSVLRQAKPRAPAIPQTINGVQPTTDWSLANAHPLTTPFARIPYAVPSVTMDTLKVGPPEKSSRPLRKASSFLRAVPGTINRVRADGARAGVSLGAMPLTRLPTAKGEPSSASSEAAEPIAKELQQVRIRAMQEIHGGDYRRWNAEDALSKNASQVERVASESMLQNPDSAPTHIAYTVDAVRSILAKANAK